MVPKCQGLEERQESGLDQQASDPCNRLVEHKREAIEFQEESAPAYRRDLALQVLACGIIVC